MFLLNARGSRAPSPLRSTPPLATLTVENAVTLVTYHALFVHNWNCYISRVHTDERCSRRHVYFVLVNPEATTRGNTHTHTHTHTYLSTTASSNKSILFCTRTTGISQPTSSSIFCFHFSMASNESRSVVENVNTHACAPVDTSWSRTRYPCVGTWFRVWLKFKILLWSTKATSVLETLEKCRLLGVKGICF